MKKNILIIALLGFLFVTGCGKNNQKSEEKEHEELAENTCEMNEEQYKLAGIELGGIEQKNISSVLKLNGIINVPPQNLITVSATMGGYVKSTSLIPGSPVKKGQVLAIIENPEFIELQQSYLESKNQLEYAEAEYQRQKELYQGNVNSAKTYQMAVSEYKTLKAKVNAYAQKLALIGIATSNLKEDKIVSSVSLVSPINSYVKSVNVNVGKYVEPTDVVFELINNDKLTLELTMFEKDLEKISEGQQVVFETTNNSGLSYKATVTRVGKAINEDKTVKVYATVDGDTRNLIAGMYVTAKIETGESMVDALPDDAIVTFEDKNYIFISKGKRAENGKTVNDFQMIEITKGNSAGGYTQVTLPEKFIKTGKNIVIKGAYALLAALKNAGEMSC